MSGGDLHGDACAYLPTLSRAEVGRLRRIQVEARIPVVGPGWQNRSISENLKVQAHGRPPYKQSLPDHLRELLIRTLPGRIALLFAGVALVGLATAALAHFVLGAFPSYGEAIWSAIAHLVDPGSIGDDQTAAERIIGLIQVLAGIVFIAGIVLTVLTEVIDRALRRLQQGDPAIDLRGHLLIVGYNGSLGEVCSRLAGTIAADHPEIVVMLPPAEADHRDNARRDLSSYPARSRVVVADPRADGFFRVCAGAARHVVILSPEGEADRADLEATGRAILLAEHLEPVADEAPAVAVELRRGRNVNAFWVDEDDSGRIVNRFPENFDALVNDRTIGALLSLAVLNPVFVDIFLGDDTAAVLPRLVPAGTHAGGSFGDARSGLPQFTLLGVVSGSGPAARATYLPPDDLRLGGGDRLIVISAPDSAPERAPGPEPRSVKVTPTRPGPLLILGWSDAARALVEDLDSNGFDLSRIQLLDTRRPPGFPGSTPGADPGFIEGDPTETTDIADAIDRADPDMVFVAIRDGNEPGAVVSGKLARQVTDVPVVVEQNLAGAGTPARLVATGLTVVSTSGLLADTVALSLADPAILVAREQMLADPGIALESLTYTGQSPLPLRELAAIFGQAGSVPLAVSVNDGAAGTLGAGDHILALQRIADPDDA